MWSCLQHETMIVISLAPITEGENQDKFFRNIYKKNCFPGMFPKQSLSPSRVSQRLGKWRNMLRSTATFTEIVPKTNQEHCFPSMFAEV
jgi:hypothetical protein